ncbi:hypothetical protein B4U45_09695 [Mycobacterium persicum]|uniref:Uncharacterized protein n=1 Tax=Mycobacterium persicum TaxID=1487726 RepID=A0A8E2IRP2_9MYCO|nr:hypothetical protein BST40_14065 [Mycobacterium persicum]ORB94851.1 hypothetical protein B1T44_10375 [Mycobacterium persicum]ORC06851.1 hypothetical protein B4U45_09695 [Mycobacterium persicum]
MRAKKRPAENSGPVCTAFSRFGGVAGLLRRRLRVGTVDLNPHYRVPYPQAMPSQETTPVGGIPSTRGHDVPMFEIAGVRRRPTPHVMNCL